jgi:hypothetical protein
MENNLEKLRAETYGKGSKDLIPLIEWWGALAVLTGGLDRVQENDAEAIAEAERPEYWSTLQVRPSWYSRVCAAAGQRLIALGRRLEARGAARLSLQPGSP